MSKAELAKRVVLAVETELREYYEAECYRASADPRYKDVRYDDKDFQAMIDHAVEDILWDGDAKLAQLVLEHPSRISYDDDVRACLQKAGIFSDLLAQAGFLEIYKGEEVLNMSSLLAAKSTYRESAIAR